MRLSINVQVLAIIALLGSACRPPKGPTQEQKLAPGEHTADLGGGLELAYHVSGAGPVLIMIPGGPGLDWSYLAAPELDAHVTSVILEPEGTGKSSRLPDPKGYTIERYAEDVEKFRAWLGQDKVFLLGHSFGGFVAQRYAIAHSDHLAGLVLYDTSPTVNGEWQADVEAGFDQFKDQPWYADAMKAFSEEGSVVTDAEATALIPRELPLYFADYEGHKNDPRLTELRAYRDPLHASAASTAFDYRPELAGIRAPTLVIVGKADKITAERWSDELAGKIAGAKKVVLEQSGHFGHIEEPAAFAAAIAAFVTVR